MKIALSIIAVFLFFATAGAQTRTISEIEFDKPLRFAGPQTIKAYPLIYKQTITFIKNGKTVRAITEVREHESAEYERIKTTDLIDDRETSRYQIKVGYGNVFCSEDGARWKPSKNECSRASIYLPGMLAESVEYSVTEKFVDGKKVMVYRKYSVIPAVEDEPKTFEERTFTIDSRGYLLSIIDTYGTLDPRTVTLTREQSWITQARIEPVTAPIK